VDLIATVVDKDDAGRIDFYGQAVMNAGAALKHAAITGKKQRFKMNLGAMTVEPRETSNRQKLKMDKINEPVSGKVYLELFTFSNVTTKCGVLEEMLSALITGAKKKWWAVLGDLRGAGLELMLFSHQGDSRPKVSIPIRSGTHIVWHEDVVIKIGSMDSTYVERGTSEASAEPAKQVPYTCPTRSLAPPISPEPPPLAHTAPPQVLFHDAEGRRQERLVQQNDGQVQRDS